MLISLAAEAAAKSGQDGGGQRSAARLPVNCASKAVRRTLEDVGEGQPASSCCVQVPSV